MHLCILFLTADVTPKLVHSELWCHHLYLILNNEVITTTWLSELWRNRIHWKTNWTLTSQLAFVYHMYNSDITTFTNAFWTLTSQPCLYWTLMSKPARVHPELWCHHPLALACYILCSEGSRSLTLSYSSKINGYLYHQRVSPPLKKACCPSSRVWQPSADSNGSLAPFLFEFQLSGSTRSLIRRVCRRSAPMAVKAHWGLIYRPILDLGFLLKRQCHHKIQEDSCKEIQLL